MYDTVVLLTLVGLVAAGFDPDLHAKYLTIPKPAFIEYFNAQNYSWKMAEHKNIDKKYTACAKFDKESLAKLPLLTRDLEAPDLPENFDAREKWLKCETIKDIYNQGTCGSCWTFGTATTASDRTCIHKDIHVRLSEQDFECQRSDVCEGGFPKEAFEYWQAEGLVTQECKPYSISELKKNKCVTECVNTDMNYKENKHFAEKVYSVNNKSDTIKAELVKNGPIQAGFVVFEDFYNYRSGIYVHTHGRQVGMHSARVIGYGVENDVEYWLVANSWGSTWGENGLFRIKSYQDEIDFENYLFAGKPNN